MTAPRRAPTGSISEPSQDSTRCSRSVGRMKASSGPTTVGPDTTNMAPRRLARICEPTASARISLTPSRIWLVLMTGILPCAASPRRVTERPDAACRPGRGSGAG